MVSNWSPQMIHVSLFFFYVVPILLHYVGVDRKSEHGLLLFQDPSLDCLTPFNRESAIKVSTL